MKIGFISPFGPGHFNPMTALARQVQLRHHEVVYLASPVVEPLVRAIGLPFASFGQRESLSALTENVKSRLAQLSKLQGEDASRMVLQIVAVCVWIIVVFLPRIP